MRYYVTADTHGYYSILESALREKGFFDDDTPHKLLVLGDLMDRGNEAVKMQNFILDLMSKDAVILIRGNHEDLFDSLITEDGGKAYSHHIHNGTYDTALQLTGYDKAMAAVERWEFAKKAMETPFYDVIIPAMLNYYETEHYIFTHGWIPCLKGRGEYHYLKNWRKANENLWSFARWLNGMEASSMVSESKTIVCGHWNASYGHSKIEKNGSEFGEDADHSPYYGKGIIAIDACTAVSGRINCLVIDDEPVLQEEVMPGEEAR